MIIHFASGAKRAPRFWVLSFIWLGWFASAGVISAAATAPGELAAWKSKLTFHASFDTHLTADYALGDPRIYTAADLSRQRLKPGIDAGLSVRHSEQGRWSGALRFDDNSEAVVMYRGENNLPYAADGFDLTISFWMKLDPDRDLKPGYVDPLQITDKKWNDAAVFVDFTQDDSPRHFRLGVLADYAFWNPDDIAWDDLSDDRRPLVVVKQTPFSNDRWTHVVITLKDINRNRDGVAELFLDGQSQGQLRRPQRFSWNPADVAIMLGIKYIGAIDDLAIFAGAMNADEVAALRALPGGVGALGAKQSRDDTSAANASADEKSSASERANADWIQLFNGRDLNDWQVKIRGYDLGDNFGNTFRVENGLLKVGYEAYDEFRERFGHIFYRQPFSSYDLRVEYRFVGQQAKGGPGWAIRNSGVMVHGQDPATMTKDQDFPASIEVQLLGGNGQDPRTTANLCTPGTNVVMNGELVTRHCTSSASKTYHGDQWVTALVKVRGNRIIEHVMDGEVVLSYEQPQLDERDENGRRLAAADGKMLHQGTISLQSESHPVEFRKVELRPVP